MCVCVCLGRTAREFDAREGDEDEDLDADGFRDEEVSDDDERRRKSPLRRLPASMATRKKYGTELREMRRVK